MPGPLDIVGRRGRHARGKEQTTDKPALTGWEAIEDHMKRYDEGLVKDFTDDIDTMLVFAGLFSAVLTAFLAPTYQLLQPDKTQEVVDLLTSISTQLTSFTVSPSFVNATQINSQSTPFHAAASAIAINALWFLSLTFSLAAALFGLLVKQWLREYMKWDNVLAPPRENVLIRQVRLEAWEGWKVSAIISSIPALLEVAVILFFSGMIVLIWTLERVVAIVVTAAIGFFLALTIIFTLLPVLYRRCPYKTPSAWAVLYVYHSSRRVLVKSPECRVIIALKGRLSRTWRRWTARFFKTDSHVGPNQSSNDTPGIIWKTYHRWTQYLTMMERALNSDLRSVTSGEDLDPDSDFESVGGLHGNSRHAPEWIVLHWRDRDLHTITSDSKLHSRIVWPTSDYTTGANSSHSMNTSRSLASADRHTTILYEYEFDKLTDALTWVLSGSDSEPLRRNVFQCLQSVRRPDGHSLRVARMRYVHMISVLRGHPVWRILEREATFDAYRKIDCLGWMKGKMYTYMLHNIGFWHYLNYSQFSLSHTEREDVQAELFLRFMLHELKYQFELWELLLQEKRDFFKNFQEATERVVELTTVLLRTHAAFFNNRPLHADFLVEVTAVLVDVYGRIVAYDNAHRTGVVAIILEVLCMWGDVTFESHGRLRAQPIGLNESYNTTDMLDTLRRLEPVTKQFYDAYDQASRHTFILLTQFSFGVIDMFSRGYPDIRRISKKLLTRMHDVADRSIMNKKKNCGGWIDLPWVRIILEILEGEVDASANDVILTYQSDKQQLVQLLSTLEACSEQGLLTDPAILTDLTSCFDLLNLHTDRSGELPPDWQWRIDRNGAMFYVQRLEGETFKTSHVRPPDTMSVTHSEVMTVPS